MGLVIRILLFLLLLIPSVVSAQQARYPAPPPTVPAGSLGPSRYGERPILVVKPPVESLHPVFGTTDLPWAHVVTQVNYDDDGRPVDAKILSASGDASLDDAVLVWVKGTRISPGAKSGLPLYIPFWFIGEDVECTDIETPGPTCLRNYRIRDFDKPLLNPSQISSFALWGGSDAAVDVYFEHNASGKLSRIVSLMEGGRSYDSKWRGDDDVTLTTSNAGYGRVRYRLIAVSNEQEAVSRAGDDIVLVWRTAENDERLLIDKFLIQSILSVRQQMLRAHVPVDVVYARIFYNADGMVLKAEPEPKQGQDPARLRSAIEPLLLERALKVRPGRAGSRRVKIYPDGSVLPVD